MPSTCRARIAGAAATIMGQGSRPERVGDLIRSELTQLLAREVKDPGLGFVTVTGVRLTNDLQLARVYYTALGDDRRQRDTARALERAASFLRREIGRRIRLKRTPEITFVYDESIAQQDRIEQLLREHASEPVPEPHDTNESGEE